VCLAISRVYKTKLAKWSASAPWYGTQEEPATRQLALFSCAAFDSAVC
jgi:hypothetical protein